MKILIPLLFLLRILPKPSEYCLYDRIRYVYGIESFSLLNRLLNSSKKLQKSSLDIELLQHCKLNNVVHKFLKFKIYSRNLMSGAFYKTWQEELLNLEIRNKQESLIKFEMDFVNEKLVNSSGGYTIHKSLNLWRVKLQHFAHLLSGLTVRSAQV